MNGQRVLKTAPRQQRKPAPASAQVTFLGHACILVEMAGASILMDPWLVGPSEANAWWHAPAAAVLPEELGRIDYILISHVHDDHFHLQTLKRLPKSATPVIPYGLDPWMRDTLREMGFARVLELEHGVSYRLPEGIEVKNFQRGRIDSLYWLRARGETVLNLNDCPVTESWLREWLRSHPRPDIALGAFSYASPYPVCYDVPGWDKERICARSAERIAKQFADHMGLLQPRYAVPFATQYAFLLPQQAWMNRYTPTPVQALKTLAARQPGVRGVLLNPGDRLSVADGPLSGGRAFNWAQREDEFAFLASSFSRGIAAALDGELAPPADFFERFSAYFERLLRRNRGLRRRINTAIAFVPEPGGERWIVDCRKTSRWVSRGGNAEAAIEIRLPATLLWAAIDGQLHWETLYLSNRLRVRLSKELLAREWDFWRMLFNFPQGVLRDRLRFLTPRGLRLLFRRYPELLGLLWERLAAPSRRDPYEREGGL